MLPDRHEIPQALGHFLALDLQEAVMHPDIGERMPAMGTFALRDLVFVVRKGEIDAAAMNVEAFTQQAFAHGRAFDMPARPAAAPGAVPAWHVFVRRLPQ